MNAVGKIMQPRVHRQSGDGGCDQDRNTYQPDKIAGQQQGNVGCGGAQNLSDTYFFDALFGRESGEPEEPQTGDQDGDTGKIHHQRRSTLFLFVVAGEILVDKAIDEGRTGVDLVPGLPQPGKCGGKIGRLDLGDRITVSVAEEITRREAIRVNRFLKPFRIEIRDDPYDPHHMRGTLELIADLFSQSMCKPEAELLNGGGIQYQGITICFYLRLELPAGQKR